MTFTFSVNQKKNYYSEKRQKNREQTHMMVAILGHARIHRNVHVLLPTRCVRALLVLDAVSRHDGSVGTNVAEILHKHEVFAFLSRAEPTLVVGHA